MITFWTYYPFHVSKFWDYHSVSLCFFFVEHQSLCVNMRVSKQIYTSSNLVQTFSMLNEKEKKKLNKKKVKSKNK